MCFTETTFWLPKRKEFRGFLFLAAFRKFCEKRQLASSWPSVRLSSWNKSIPTGRIWEKFWCFWVFFQKSVEKIKFPLKSNNNKILSSHLRLGLPNGLFPSGFPTRTLCTPIPSPIRATFPAHLILLDFTTRTILGKEYRSLSFSLCNFLHSPTVRNGKHKGNMVVSVV